MREILVSILTLKGSGGPKKKCKEYVLPKGHEYFSKCTSQKGILIIQYYNLK
ncbi:hypothetical protein KSS87_020267, partial [Heliosperma pusillum]